MSNLKERLEKIIAAFKIELAALRTGRATPALVENLEVDYYGTKTPLKAVASILSPEPRTLLIQPWDKNAIPAIEKAIQVSSLGLNPVTDREAIRLTIPSLTEERRRELVKILKKHSEEARIRVRQEREAALKELERQGEAKQVSEDQKFRQKNEVQKLVDEYNKKIEDLADSKEKEIMTV